MATGMSAIGPTAVNAVVTLSSVAPEVEAKQMIKVGDLGLTPDVPVRGSGGIPQLRQPFQPPLGGRALVELVAPLVGGGAMKVLVKMLSSTPEAPPPPSVSVSVSVSESSSASETERSAGFEFKVNSLMTHVLALMDALGLLATLERENKGKFEVMGFDRRMKQADHMRRAGTIALVSSFVSASTNLAITAVGSVQQFKGLGEQRQSLKLNAPEINALNLEVKALGKAPLAGPSGVGASELKRFERRLDDISNAHELNMKVGETKVARGQAISQLAAPAGTLVNGSKEMLTSVENAGQKVQEALASVADKGSDTEREAYAQLEAFLTQLFNLIASIHQSEMGLMTAVANMRAV